MVPPSSWFEDEQTQLPDISSSRLGSYLGVNVDSVSVTTQTMSFEVDVGNVAGSALSTNNRLGDSSADERAYTRDNPLK